MRSRIRLFFLIDALGWTYIRDTAFLSDILAFRFPLRTVLGYSSAAIPSILTGKKPRDHGQWNLLFFNPNSSPFRWISPFLRLPPPLLENRYARYFIDNVTRRLTRHKGYFSSYGLPTRFLPMFDLSEKKNIYKPDGIPGSQSIFDMWKSQGIDFRSYSYHDYSDRQIIAHLKKNIQHGAGSVHFVYLAEMDAVLHDNCKNDLFVNQVLSVYELWLRQTMDIAQRKYHQVEFFVFSDHGMTPITGSVDLRAMVETSGLRLGDDYIAVYDSTMGRFWFRSDRAAETLVAILSNCRGGHLLSQTEMVRLGIDFDHNDYGDLIFLADPGVVISPNYFHSYMPAGMHGFHPDDRYSYGSYLSNVNTYTPESITDLMEVFRGETPPLC